MERGIPCKAFRFPTVSGASETGKQDLNGGTTHALKWVIHLLSTGLIPETDALLIQLPPDVCAEICISIFFNTEAPTGIYNVINPHHTLEIGLSELVPEFRAKLVIIQLYGVALKQAKRNGKDTIVSCWINVCKQHGINLENFEEIMHEFVSDPSKIFDNERIADYLLELECEGKIGSLHDIIELLKTSEMSVLRPFADFYAEGGTYEQLAQNYKNVTEKFGIGALQEGKIVKYIPHLKERLSNPLKYIRNDLNYVLKNARELFPQ